MSGGISHSQGSQDKPRGLRDGSKLPEVMPPPQQWAQFPAELPKAPLVHGCVVDRDPPGVRALIGVRHPKKTRMLPGTRPTRQWDSGKCGAGRRDMEPSLSQGCRGALAGLGQVVGALSRANAARSTLLPPIQAI